MFSFSYVDSINFKTTSKAVINKFKFLISKKKIKDIYFNVSQDCLGLKIFENGYSIIRIIFYNMKNFNTTVKVFSSKIIPHRIKHKKINNLYITWGSNKNFKKSGEFNDFFLNKNSREEKNNLFIVFYNDKSLPTKIDKNILIFYQNHRLSILNYLKFLNLVLSNLLNITQTIINFNWQTLYSDKVQEKVFSYIQNLNIKKAYCAYEGHTYQKKILHYLKIKKTKTLAVLTTVPSPYPINFFYKKTDSFIDKFYINSLVQKKVFINYLDWPKEKIIIQKPTRVTSKKLFEKPTLYLSINTINEDNILKNLDNFLKDLNSKFYPLVIRFHPNTEKTKKNYILKNKIKYILQNYKNKFTKNTINRYSLFFGPTGAIIQALKNQQKVVQICDHNVLDVYNPYIWKNLNVYKVSLGAYVYQMKYF